MLLTRVRPFLALSAALALIAVSSCKNSPPAMPLAPEGAVNCYLEKQYNYTTAATDPNGDNVAVRFDWGDSVISDWTDWSASGDDVTLSHTWADTGTYQVRAQAQDKKLLSSDWSTALPVQVLPRPEVPSVPVGPTLCFKDTTYVFKSLATDRFGDSVSIRFDWGSDTSDWSPFVAPGETVAASHAWTHVGHFPVTAQARDPELHTTDWSDDLEVEVIVREGPNTPAVPDGPYRGDQGSPYDFAATGTHPQNLPVAIRLDWGDGDTSGWGQFKASGETTSMSHAWDVSDTFEVRAQAKDTGGALSAWSDARNILIRPVDTLRIWRYQINAGLSADNYSSPAIAPDGTIYVGSQDDYLYAVNPDGTLKWRFETGSFVRSSPAIGADGTVYVGSYDHRLYALDPTDGSVKWSYATGGVIPSSPAVAGDGTIIFGSGDTNIYALNPDSTLKWKYPTGRAVYSSPAIAPDGTIYCGSNDDYLYALTSVGAFKWRFAAGRDIVGAPAVAANGTVYFGSLDGRVYAVDPSGTMKWSIQTNGPVYCSPAIGPDGTIYVGSNDNLLYALDSAGRTKWRYVVAEDVKSSPAISANGTIYFGSEDNNLYAIRTDSTTVWSYPTDNDITSSPTIGADGKVYFVGNDGYLYQLKGTSPLAGTDWPKFRHDIENNGRFGAK